MSLADFHPNRFVASPEMVRTIQARYAHYFPERGLIADLGCGEGIFLEILRDSGRSGIGVERTQEFVAGIKKRGLKAVRQDIFHFLRKNRSRFEGVFASHIIEHFHPDQGLKLMESMVQSLRAHGVVVLITPTYHDILVSGERFWLDITHARPYPLPLLHEFFVHQGLKIVDEGEDPNTRIPLSLRHPRSSFRHLVGKIRFGRRYNAGDTYIVAKKPGPR